MPPYSKIFQPETSFRTQIVDLENEDKKSAWFDTIIAVFFQCQNQIKDTGRGIIEIFQ